MDLSKLKGCLDDLQARPDYATREDFIEVLRGLYEHAVELSERVEKLEKPSA